MINFSKLEVQNIEDEKDMAAARKSFVRMQLEGERPTKYFCNMNKKFQEKAQFKEIILEEVDESRKDMMKPDIGLHDWIILDCIR